MIILRKTKRFSIKEKINRLLELISFSDFLKKLTVKEYKWSKQLVNKYKSLDNLLRHAKTDKDIDGVFLINKNELVGYIAWKGDYLQALEVTNKYRNSGYGEQLLRKAIDSGVKKLSVRKTNIPPINLYKKLGFKKTKDLNSVMIEMELSKS